MVRGTFVLITYNINFASSYSIIYNSCSSRRGLVAYTVRRARHGIISTNAPRDSERVQRLPRPREQCEPGVTYIKCNDDTVGAGEPSAGYETGIRTKAVLQYDTMYYIYT